MGKGKYGQMAEEGGGLRQAEESQMPILHKGE